MLGETASMEDPQTKQAAPPVEQATSPRASGSQPALASAAPDSGSQTASPLAQPVSRPTNVTYTEHLPRQKVQSLELQPCVRSGDEEDAADSGERTRWDHRMLKPIAAPSQESVWEREFGVNERGYPADGYWNHVWASACTAATEEWVLFSNYDVQVRVC